MKKSLVLITLFAGLICTGNAQNSQSLKINKEKKMINMTVEEDRSGGSSESIDKNPLLIEWKTPYQTPPFKEIKMEHYMPAFEEAIARATEEIRIISQTKAEPTFENTILAMQFAGEQLDKVSSIFFNMLSANTNEKMQDMSKTISPMMTQYSNSIYLNIPLFYRVKAVYERREEYKGEEKMLIEKTYNAFVKNGANLSKEDRATFEKLSMSLAKLSLQFSHNVLAANNDFTAVYNEKELAGMPEGTLKIAAEKAEAKGMKGYLFDLSAPSYMAIMKYADNRDIRETFYREYNSRSLNKHSNQKVIVEILQLREKLANLLGFKDYASYALQDRMAENSQKVYELLNELKEASLPVAQDEMKELKKFAKKNGLRGEFQKWDFSYYAEKQKNDKFNISDELLKPYFKLENVIDGVFTLSKNLFGLEYIENKKIQTYHPDVTAYEVMRGGELMGILYMDFHPRDSKRSGAWMTSFREQGVDNKGKDVRPVVSLVMNFTPSTKEQPSLLTFDEVTTFLHEFGHGLHGLLANTKYSALSGTNVPRDFVELPSQMMENWAIEQEFLKTFAYHYQTKELIPQNLVEKLINVDNYLAGYYSIRQLSFGYIDMMWHTVPAGKISNIIDMENNAIADMELMPTVSETCMSTAFGHIFSGGYAAGYYSYKWAEVLEADAFSLFKEKGVMNKEVADSFVEEILSKGGSRKVMESYVKFRGHEPETAPLLIKSGLQDEKKK